MNRTMRWGTTLAASATALVVMSTAANAAQPYRLAGKFNTKTTITENVNYPTGPPKGTTATRVWTFTPQCPSGTCKTTAKRPSIVSSTVFTEVYTPQSNGTYKYVTQKAGDCVDSQGRLIAHNAFTETSTIIITPNRRVGTRVTAYIGTNRSVSVRRPNAPSNCHNGHLYSTFKTVG
jgi:hypothetical protein